MNTPFLTVFGPFLAPFWTPFWPPFWGPFGGPFLGPFWRRFGPIRAPQEGPSVATILMRGAPYPGVKGTGQWSPRPPPGEGSFWGPFWGPFGVVFGGPFWVQKGVIFGSFSFNAVVVKHKISGPFYFWKPTLLLRYFWLVFLPVPKSPKFVTLVLF